MRRIDVTNAEALRALDEGREIKLLLDERRLHFAYLNVQHSEMERGVFGYDGTLRRSIPGYVKPGPKTVELRACPAFSVERVRRLLDRLFEVPALSVLEGFRVRYGPASMGLWRSSAPTENGEEEDGTLTPVVYDMEDSR